MQDFQNGGGGGAPLQALAPRALETLDTPLLATRAHDGPLMDAV